MIQKKFLKHLKRLNQLRVNQTSWHTSAIYRSKCKLNIAFPAEANPKWINQVHLDAWKKGIKTLYYMRTESVLRGDIAARAMDEACLSCDG